jgi:hypothetical protein
MILVAQKKKELDRQEAKTPKEWRRIKNVELPRHVALTIIIVGT